MKIKINGEIHKVKSVDHKGQMPKLICGDKEYLVTNNRIMCKIEPIMEMRGADGMDLTETPNEEWLSLIAELGFVPTIAYRCE